MGARRVLTVIALAVLSSWAAAQLKPSLDAGAAMLAGGPEFRSTLPADRQKALDHVLDQFQLDLRAHGEGLQANTDKGLSPKERVAWAQKDQTELYARFTQGVFAALSPDQAERLRRLALRHYGPRMLRLPEVARRVGLSEEQRQAVAKRVAAFDHKSFDMSQGITNRMIHAINLRIHKGENVGQEEVHALATKANAQVEAARPKIQALRKKEDARIMALLRPTQRKAWEKSLAR